MIKQIALGLMLLTIISCSGESGTEVAKIEGLAPTPTPTYTPTPTQPPELVKPTPVSADEELRTIRSKASGILFEVPVSWEPVQTDNGLKIQGKHGDVLIGNSSRPFEDLVVFTDAYIASLNQYSENKRTVLDDKVTSTGLFENAYRKFVFFENGLGKIAMIAFTANPQYLDEYIHIFEISSGLPTL